MIEERSHDEPPVETTPVKARQGVISHRVIKVLAISLAIVAIVWGAIEIYYRADTPEPAGQGQMLEGEPEAAPAE